MSMHVTQDNNVILNGIFIGNFEDIQRVIAQSRPDLIQKYKIKAVYMGGNKIRWIADWEGCIEEYITSTQL